MYSQLVKSNRINILFIILIIATMAMVTISCDCNGSDCDIAEYVGTNAPKLKDINCTLDPTVKGCEEYIE